jgi:hypothetical protein
MHKEVDQAIKTLHVCIKDRHAKALLGLGRAVNFVWTFCQQSSLKILGRECQFCNGYDLDKLTCGASKEGACRCITNPFKPSVPNIATEAGQPC